MGLIILCLSASDWIAIGNISVTAIIGLWIGIVVNGSFTANRAVKDYFIKECQEIKDKYGKLNNDLYAHKCSSEYIINWFKIMTIKIDNFESILCNELNIKPDISDYNNIIKKYITGTDEFNIQYTLPVVKFSPLTINEIIRHHKEFTIRLAKQVIKINRAKKKFHWWYKVTKNRWWYKLSKNC